MNPLDREVLETVYGNGARAILSIIQYSVPWHLGFTPLDL